MEREITIPFPDSLCGSVITRITILCLISVVSFSFLIADDDKPPTRYEILYDSLTHLIPDATKGSFVSNLVIQRDVATLSMHEGKLFLCTPAINHRMHAAIFFGSGSFSFFPPTSIEREQLYRYYEQRSLNEPFTIVLMLFADSTLEELSAKLKFGNLEPPAYANETLRECLRYVSEDDGKYFDEDLMKTFLEGENNGIFYGHIVKKESGDPLMVRITPTDDEEVSLLKRAKTVRFYRNPEIVNRFHKSSDYLVNPKGINEEKKFLSVVNYDLHCTISDGLDFSAIANMSIVSGTQQQWLSFDLHPKLEIDSVFDRFGNPLEFFKGEENSTAWLHLQKPVFPNDTFSIVMHYHGNILHKNQSGYIEFKAPDDWYPRTAYREKSSFDISYQTPADLKFVSTGKQISSNTAGEIVNSRWVSTKPMRNASFNIGYFKDVEVKGESVRPISVYVTEKGDLEDNVADDVLNSVTFYHKLFGAAPMEHLFASEIPYGHGEAFPGLIHLSWYTFQVAEREGFNHVFRGHEVAHQWWGIGVDFKTYHDQWLSEGFSEYSGLMYLQAAYKDNDKFFDMLKDWKDDILNNRKFLFGSGQESGPISLGYRTHSSETKGDYDLIIYKKGAWVLHMLRNMLLDQQSMKEDKFNSMMQEFYSKYLDKKASTEDFRKVVEGYTKGDMQWFFDQWVDGTSIPKYTVAHSVQETPEGKFVVHYRVKQENVPQDFQMPVPLYIDFGSGKFARIRVLIKGPLSEFDLPLLPLRPEQILFNDLESVLCEVEYEDWK